MFTHLHNHTEYSLLDGMCRIPQLVARAKELGMESLAITDHGVMHGVIQFYLAAREAGIRPVIGCEVYVAESSRFERAGAGKDTNHVVLLAKNRTGYQNLIRLITKANLESFYYKPRLDKELLTTHSEGLIALSACMGGEIPRLCRDGRLEEAKRAALWYRQTFGDFYIEIMRHPIPELEQINRKLIPLARELDIPLVATNDTHYVHQADAPSHDLLLCIGTNTTVHDEKRLKMPGDFYYLKSPQEMTDLYRDIPDALENTARIAGMCNVELEFGRLHLPEIDLPPGRTPQQFLTDLCAEGLSRYYPQPTSEIRERLAYELEVIEKTEFANYFLNVWDIISFARKNNILYGVRGSAAASIVLRCLGITEVDPIENKLVFERFLNVERREMPDIDLDFEDDRRNEVIEYVTRRYGQDHVAQIITFGTLGARAALRDVGRALGMSYGDVDRVARLVPPVLNMTLERAMTENGELRDIYQNDTAVRTLVDSARKVEGIVRHASTHAAGIVIAREPLTGHVPLQRTSKSNGEQELVMTQYTMEDIARIGLLKMDLLGLINLTILDRATKLIRETRGIDLDIHALPLDDRLTFESLSTGETTGVFQLESSGMRRYIKQLKPRRFSDIAAMVALYRPGPMEHIPTYIQAKNDPSHIHYPHPVLAGILEETYGVIVYQEQVLFIVRALAGYSLGQADIFRKAMGKKIPEVMHREKGKFLEGAARNGFSEETANQVFALIEPFAGYAFNKAHAVSYGLIAYQTAYLKANFPAEYFTAFLTANNGQAERVSSAVIECRRLGIDVLPPDINRSQVNFAIEKNTADGFILKVHPEGKAAIRFGLSGIKNVGSAAVEPLIAERNRGGVFESIDDLCRRADLHAINRRALESLIKVGALDCLGNRGGLLADLERILSMAQREQRARNTGQVTMFDLFGRETPVPMPGLQIADVDVPLQDRLIWEKELLGIRLSMANFTRGDGTLCGEINADRNGDLVTVAGEIAVVQQMLTRKDRKPFISATLEDVSGKLEVMVWTRLYNDTKALWLEGNIVEVTGKVELRDDRVRLICESVRPYEQKDITPQEVMTPARAGPLHSDDESERVEPGPPAPPPPQESQRLTISLLQTGDADGDAACLNELARILKDHPGTGEVLLRVAADSQITTLRMPQRVQVSPGLQERLAALVGKEAIKVDTAPGR